MKILSKIYWVVATLVLASPIIFGAFLLLKITYVVNWSWLAVTSPIWGALLLLMVAIIAPIIAISIIDGCAWLKGVVVTVINDVIGNRKKQ
ncbi:MAG: hypothetical protein ACI4AK_01575 [Lepagella sp.]